MRLDLGFAQNLFLMICVVTDSIDEAGDDEEEDGGLGFEEG